MLWLEYNESGVWTPIREKLIYKSYNFQLCSKYSQYTVEELLCIDMLLNGSSGVTKLEISLDFALAKGF